MAKQYAVLHTEKGKGVGGGTGNHVDRTLGMEHTFPHADPSRLHLNQEHAEAYKNLTVPEAVVKRIHQGYKGTRKIRGDAVKYLETILTGSHEQMTRLHENPKDLQAWVNANLDFAEDEFGKENIIRFTLHLDEKTPHIHCIHVPITKDGRLSAKEVMGDRNVLKSRQDRYAIAMKRFGLERGQSREGVYHEKAQEYYRRINITEDFVANLDVKELFGIDTDKTLENTKNALKSTLLALERQEKMNERMESEIKRMKDKFYTLQNTKLDEAEKYQHLRELMSDPSRFEELKEKIQLFRQAAQKKKAPKTEEQAPERKRGFRR